MPISRYPSRSELGRAIRELRLERGLSIAALAAKADMHDTYLSKIERARSSPTWEKLTSLANALGIEMSQLAKAAEAKAAARRRRLKRKSG